MKQRIVLLLPRHEIMYHQYCQLQVMLQKLQKRERSIFFIKLEKTILRIMMHNPVPSDSMECFYSATHLELH